MKISSKTNDKIKELREITKSSAKRKSSGLFVCDGLRLCGDAAVSGCAISSVFYTAECFKKHEEQMQKIMDCAESTYELDEKLMNYVSDTVSPQGVICLIKTADNAFSPQKGRRYIALDDLQNPDNLGAVMRTAEALGIDGIIVAGGCDIYNPKAVRASMGAVFRLPVLIVKDLPGFLHRCNEAGINTYASVPDSNAKDICRTDFSNGGICVIGNEGNGVGSDTIKECKESITIMMKGRAESLNAASAAAVIMWEMTK
ncbi:MAG: RNA methyltransferase [Clostridiales bacterium]|nr:RNA methyltransferase [Clostridiales bacterium]